MTNIMKIKTNFLIRSLGFDIFVSLKRYNIILQIVEASCENRFKKCTTFPFLMMKYCILRKIYKKENIIKTIN